MGGSHLLLYDGVCGLCNWLVQLVLAHDPHGVFHFAALQSDAPVPSRWSGKARPSS